MTDDESRGTPSWTQRGMFHVQSPTWKPWLPSAKTREGWGLWTMRIIQSSDFPPLHSKEREALPTLPSHTLIPPLCCLTISISVPLPVICHLKMIPHQQFQSKKKTQVSLKNQHLQCKQTVCFTKKKRKKKPLGSVCILFRFSLLSISHALRQYFDCGNYSIYETQSL